MEWHVIPGGSSRSCLTSGVCSWLLCNQKQHWARSWHRKWYTFTWCFSIKSNKAQVAGLVGHKYNKLIEKAHTTTKARQIFDKWSPQKNLFEEFLLVQAKILIQYEARKSVEICFRKPCNVFLHRFPTYLHFKDQRNSFRLES